MTIYLPDFKKIKELESIAQKTGSGICYENLIGCWRFQYVWQKGTYKIDNVTSSLLQVFSASLELSNLDIDDKTHVYEIKNSIKFMGFSVVFQGRACLKGKRPLLPFDFENLLVKFANFKIFEIRIKSSDKSSNSPFFALIAIDKNKS